MPGLTIPGNGIFFLGSATDPATASVTVASSLQGAEANGVYTLFRGANWRVGLLGGFRWAELQENLSFEAASNTAGFAGAGRSGNSSFALIATTTGSLSTFTDRFETTNNFYGGQLGVATDFSAGRWSVRTTAKVALGSVRQHLEISGANTAFPSFVTLLANGGIYAQPSNIGQHNATNFAVAPEVGLNVGYQVTEALRASLGYNFFYINRVVRPGDQLQNIIDVMPVFNGRPGVVPSSATLFKETDFWTHGVSFSVELRS